MKRSYGKLLVAASIPLMIAAEPAVTLAANCTGDGTPTKAATIAPGAKVNRTARIGAGTEIGPNVTIGRRVHIGTCSTIGIPAGTVSIATKASLGDGVTINSGSVARDGRVGDGSTLDGTSVGVKARVGANATVTNTIIAPYAWTGDAVTMGGVAGVYVGRYAAIKSTVDVPLHIGDSVSIGAYACVGTDVSDDAVIPNRFNYGCY